MHQFWDSLRPSISTSSHNNLNTHHSQALKHSRALPVSSVKPKLWVWACISPAFFSSFISTLPFKYSFCWPCCSLNLPYLKSQSKVASQQEPTTFSLLEHISLFYLALHFSHTCPEPWRKGSGSPKKLHSLTPQQSVKQLNIFPGDFY